jgi:choline dehydrogenase
MTSAPELTRRHGYWDDIVVGSGTAGSLVAARLSQDPQRAVLLIEAGGEPVCPPGNPGAPILAGLNWDWQAKAGGARDRIVSYPLGRAVGGSAEVNGSVALRAFPSDFARWSATAGQEWSWQQVEPWFAAGERTLGLAPRVQATGPDEVGRLTGGSPLAHGFVAACREQDMDWLPDLNRCPVAGVGPVPLSAADGARVTSASTLLSGARHRSNLTVLENATVSRFDVRNGHVCEMSVVHRGREEKVRADRYVLSAGAIGTPALLLRSGIGAAASLEASGVGCVHELPGVGRNLQEHPAVGLWAVPRPSSCRAGLPWHEVMARSSSDGMNEPDVAVILLSNADISAVPVLGATLGDGPAMSLVGTALRPASRGRVTITDPNVLTPPVVELELAQHQDDVSALMSATRLAWRILRAGPTWTHVARLLMWTERMIEDDAALRSALQRFVSPSFHPVGTARMGQVGDPDAVVDPRLRLHGVDNMRIVDASVMPTIPSAPTNLSCLMIAERAATWMCA